MATAECSTELEKPVADYLRVATVSPETSIADVPANIASLTETYQAAKQQQAELVVTPELSITGYSTADLFHNQHVLERSGQGLAELARITEDGPALLVGAPLERNGILYNCAVMLAEGEIQGAIPKVHLPNAREFYERRWFTSGKDITNETIQVDDQAVPFGTDLLWDVNGTRVAAEICEDMFAPISPATNSVLAGAEVVANLSASNELIGKAEYRKLLISAFTGKTACAYVYASAGRGESVADVVYGGHQLIAENGRIVAEQAPLAASDNALVYDIDRAFLTHDRIENKTFADQAKATQLAQPHRIIEISVPRPDDDRLLRHVDPLPYLPRNPETMNARCEEIFRDISHALAQRVREKNSRAIVLGLSGGLDSTLALLMALEATKQLGEDPSFIHTITMPADASSERTQDNATLLAKAMGTTHKIKPIQALANEVLNIIGHDRETQDITYENAQARVRKLILMEYANHVGGMEEGTGDMSENAIGWCTYNGDHMSMYNPNGGVPKTLVQHLVRWYTENRVAGDTQETLLDILDTPISPELTGNGDLSQMTEDMVGPYTITDFSHFELLRHGASPAKIRYLASAAFEDDPHHDKQAIIEQVNQFLDFWVKSQWKRQVMTDTVKVGTVSNSPRGDVRLAPNISPGWRY